MSTVQARALARTIAAELPRTTLPQGISADLLALIILIVDGGPHTITEVGTALGTSQRYASDLVDRAERQRLAVRVRNHRDRRVVFVDATARAVRLRRLRRGAEVTS